MTAPAAAGETRGGRRTAAVAAALFAVVFVAWLPGLACGFVELDDPRSDPRVAVVQEGFTAEGWRVAWTRHYFGHWVPLTVLSAMADWELWGERAAGHHLTSQLLHAANAALVFLFLRRATGAPGRALAVAVLFALHPLRVEPVMWLTGRKDVLSGFFALVATWAYVSARPGRERGPLGAVFAAAALAMLAKAAVMLPVALLLLDAWPLRRGTPWRRPTLVVEKLPLFALSAVVGAVALASARAGGAIVGAAAIGWGDRAATAAVVYLRSLEQTFWPAGLAAYYPLPVGGHPPARLALAALALVVPTAVAAALVRRAPWLLAGWLWWLAWILPVSGLLQAGEQAGADRYTYLASVGLIAAVVWSVAEAVPRGRSARLALGGATAAAAAALLVATWRLIPTWRDSGALFERAVAVTAGNPFARVNLASWLREQGDRAGAERQLRQAVAESPQVALAWVDLGALLRERGAYAEAEAALGEALRLDPRLPAAHLHTAALLEEQGQPGRAVGHLAAVVTYDPWDANGWRGLADLLGRPGVARQSLPFLAALRGQHPDSPELARVVAAAEAAAAAEPVSGPAPRAPGPP